MQTVELSYFYRKSKKIVVVSFTCWQLLAASCSWVEFLWLFWISAGSQPMILWRFSCKSLIFLWRTDEFRARVRNSNLRFGQASNPSKWPPGHIWLRRCICEYRLCIENVTFWAPSIFQKLGVPDLRLLVSKSVARNQSNMKVGLWTYQSYYFHYRTAPMIWFCWTFGILRSGWPDKDRGAMLAARETVNLLFSHVRE